MEILLYGHISIESQLQLYDSDSLSETYNSIDLRVKKMKIVFPILIFHLSHHCVCRSTYDSLNYSLLNSFDNHRRDTNLSNTTLFLWNFSTMNRTGANRFETEL